MRGDACFKECVNVRAGWGREGEGLMRVSGYNFPHFLVYPFDMPDDNIDY